MRITNSVGAIIPIRENRIVAPAGLAAVNAEVILVCNGDSHATIWGVSGGTAFVGTVAFEGSLDGTNYFPVQVCQLYGSAGTLVPAKQLFLTEALSVASTLRAWSVKTAGLTNLRVRCSAYTSGTLTVSLAGSPIGALLDPFENSACGIGGTVTGVAGAAVTLTLAAPGAGLRHYITTLEIVRSATAALIAGAAPTTVTTTNLPGSPIFTFGASADLQGVDQVRKLDVSRGLAGAALNTATTIICPATTNVIWRVNAFGFVAQ